MRKDVYNDSGPFAIVPLNVARTLTDTRQLALWVHLALYAGSDGDAHPSRKTLAAHLGMSKASSVDAVIRGLRESGLLKTFPRWRDEDGCIVYEDGPGRVQTSNGYRVRMSVDDPFADEVSEAESVGGPEMGTTHRVGEGDDAEVSQKVEGVVPKRGPLGPRQGTGGGPLEGTGVVPKKGHELNTYKLHTHEVKTPLTPQRGAETPGEAKADPSPKNRYPQAFEEWWKLYPHKTGKQAALRKWRQAVKNVGGEDELLRRLKAHLPSLLATQQRDPRFVPHPTTWLGQGRYDDPVQAPDTTRQRTGMNPQDWLPDSLREPEYAQSALDMPDTIDGEVIDEWGADDASGDGWWA